MAPEPSMTETSLCFSPISSNEAGSFKLLELTQDLCSLIENAAENMSPVRLELKGSPGENAVLCTENKTFSVRSVALSNSVLVVTPTLDDSPQDFAEDAIVIRDQLNEILELQPSVPRLRALLSSIRGRQYDDGQTDDDVDSGNDSRFTYGEALKTVQASEAELMRGLKDMHILNIDGELRPISPSYLDRLLTLFLNSLIALSLSDGLVPVELLSASLADTHEVPRSISIQVMTWFGDIQEGKWKMDTPALVKEIGLSILRQHGHEPVHQNKLIGTWKGLVGDSFESYVDLSLLAGNFISGTNNPENLTYFPASSLPVDPAPRFADLFSTRARWKSQDIIPFLADIALDSKERDKLLLKFARATTDIQGIWYTARAQYNG